jgi:hypothetical protein
MATNWIRRKVWGNKGTSQKLITIPKDSDSDIKVGDLVWVKRCDGNDEYYPPGGWKGDKVGYIALHGWVRDHKPKPLLCEVCNLAPSRDLANVSGEYKRDINDFKWTCHRCNCLVLKTPN